MVTIDCENYPQKWQWFTETWSYKARELNWSQLILSINLHWNRESSFRDYASCISEQTGLFHEIFLNGHLSLRKQVLLIKHFNIWKSQMELKSFQNKVCNEFILRHDANVQPCKYAKLNSTKWLGMHCLRNSSARMRVTRWLTEWCITAKGWNEASWFMWKVNFSSHEKLWSSGKDILWPIS